MPIRRGLRPSKTITKCGFKTNKDNAHSHSVSFNGLTDGEVLALINAIRLARTISPVADDLSAYLRNAFMASDSIGAGKFAEELGREIDAQVVPKDK